LYRPVGEVNKQKLNLKIVKYKQDGSTSKIIK